MTCQYKLFVTKMVSQLKHIPGKLLDASIRISKRRVAVTTQIWNDELRLICVVFRHFQPNAVIQSQTVQEVNRLSTPADFVKHIKIFQMCNHFKHSFQYFSAQKLSLQPLC